ncbi:MAG: T9SS type A sorting domain-containing protein [Bacteroidota bacterium]
MRKLLILFFVFATVYSFAQNFQWVKSMGGTGGEGANGVAVDIDGNVYTIGAFQNGTNFDPGVTNFSITSTGTTKFITKHNAAGNFLWVKCLSSDVRMYDILIDANNRVVICGYYNNNPDFDPGSGVFNIPIPAGSASFVLKLDNNGNFIWAKGFNDEQGNLYAMTTDNASNLYFCGSYTTLFSTPDFDPGSATYNLTGGGSYVLKLDSSGNFILAKTLGYIIPSSIAVDASQNILTTGYFSGTNDFDPGTGTFTLTSTGPPVPANYHRDIFISKLDQNGNFVWAKKPSCYYGDEANSIATDGSGNVYITGYFNNGGNTGGYMDLDYPAVGQHTLSSVSTWSDSFVAKYDQFGNAVWAKNFGSTDTSDDGYALATDPAENLYVLGRFRGPVDFNAGDGPIGSGWGLAYILKLNSSGNTLVAGCINVYFSKPCNNMAVDHLQQIYIVGGATTTTDVDPQIGVVYPINAGGYDAFVLKLSTPFVGIEEKKMEKEILTIYPNPNNGSFTIKSENELKLNLTNSWGQVLQTIELNRMNNYEVKTELLSSGIYFLSGIGESQTVKQKIVVTK